MDLLTTKSRILCCSDDLSWRPFLLCLFRVDPIPYDTPKPTGHTRFVCVSDTHSRTDGIQMPYGDVLLHMGDFTELGLPSEVKKFNDWLGNELTHTFTAGVWTHTSLSCSLIHKQHCNQQKEGGGKTLLTANQTNNPSSVDPQLLC